MKGLSTEKNVHKSMNIVHDLATLLQRREDMTSRRSDNLDALITFQGQESRMQATRISVLTRIYKPKGTNIIS